MIANPTTLNFTGRLLVLPDFRNIVQNLDTLDVELLLDFILYVCICILCLYTIVAYFL